MFYVIHSEKFSHSAFQLFCLTCEMYKSVCCAKDTFIFVWFTFPSDLDTSEREAVVLFDFNPRNSKELPLKKGDTVMLRTRISSDWWEGGTSSGLKGLIPHRFIALQLRLVMCYILETFFIDNFHYQRYYNTI